MGPVGFGAPGHDLYLPGVWGRPVRRPHALLSLLPHREFIEKHYVELKKANPDLPILIRECSDVQPKLWARYGEQEKRAAWDREKGIQGHAKTCREAKTRDFGLPIDVVSDKFTFYRNIRL